MLERIPDTDVEFTVFDACRDIVPKKLARALSEDERRAIAAAVMRRLKLCKWEVWHEPMHWHSIP